MKKQSTKALAFFLAILLTVGLFPATGFAEGTESATPSSIETPAPSTTPEPSVSPDPSITPDPGATPVPTETPVVTETPVPTETPLPTPAPVDVSALTGEDLYRYLITLGEDELKAALSYLTQAQADSLNGIMTQEQALAWFGIEPFVPLELGAGFVPFLAMRTQSLDNNDLVTDKRAVYQTDDTVDITLSAYAKGVLTKIGKPADIVLVLDQSTSMGSMSGAFGTKEVYNPRSSWDSYSTNYVKVGDNYNQAYREWNSGSYRYYYLVGTTREYFTYPGTQLYSRTTQTLYRIHALIDAVTEFVQEVRAKTTTEMDFNISIVGFNASARYLTGTNASDTLLSATDTRIDTAISNLNSLANYTRQDLGLGLANDVFDTDVPEDRNRIVILFTDGEPYSGGGGVTNNDIIEDALTYARNLKNNKGTSIFTIGIGSSSLDPGTLPIEGTTGQNTFLHCVSSNYPVATLQSSSTTTYEIDNNTSNSGTYYIFRNYSGSAPSQPTGAETPLTRGNYGSGNGWYYNNGSTWIRVYSRDDYQSQNPSDNQYHFWEKGTSIAAGIIPGLRNPAEDADGDPMEFYHTADDASELSEVFLAVQESLSGGYESITVKDFMMPQFENVTGITARIGTTAIASSLINYNAATRMVSVGPIRLPAVEMEGDSPVAGELEAKQLVITFTADVKDDFIGGNDVLTNDTGSGIYGSDGDPIEDFNEPVVNIPLDYDLFDLQDQHVYLGDGASISDFFVTNNYEIDDNPFQYDGNNNGYVNIAYTVKNAAGTTIGIYSVDAGALTGDFEPGYSNTLTNLTADTWYTITASIDPSSDGDSANGTLAVPITSAGGDERANIYVYKPVVTTRNVAVHLTKNPTDAELTDNAIVSVAWMHGDDEAVPANMTEATAPDLDYTFAYAIPADPGYLTNTTAVNITGIATQRGNPASTTASLSGAGLAGLVSPFNVYVLKPTIKCVDSTMFVGDAAITWSPYLGSFVKSWSAKPGDAALIGSEPTVNLEIDLPSPAPAGASGTGFTPIADGAYGLKVKVKINSSYVTPYSTIQNDTTTVSETRHFTITVVSGQLTITKDVATTGPNAVKPGETFLFTITVDREGDANDYTFYEVIEGNGSKTIKGLPKGTYTVTEDTNWSWRYNTTSVPDWGKGGNTITSENREIAWSIANSARTPFWLSGDDAAVNKFWPFNPQPTA